MSSDWPVLWAYVEPEIHPLNGADTRAVVVWQFDDPVRMCSSAPVGGGLRNITWLTNVEVPADYARHDLGDHAGEIAKTLGLVRSGASLFTAADVSRISCGEDEGVVAHATVGITKPTWAAAAPDTYSIRDGSIRDGSIRDGDEWKPGTINIVAQLPVPLSAAAAINAVVTATEAKAQALFEARIPGTGTASDAIAVLFPYCDPSDPTPCPGEVQFAGPRSEWGSRLARAVHTAVVRGWEMHP